MTLIIIFSILIFAFAWLLLAPLYVYISTSESKFEAGLSGILKLMVKSGEDGLPEVLGRIFFVPFKVPVFRIRDSKVKAGTPKKKKKMARKLTRKRIRLVLKIVWQIIKSFKLKQLKLNIDTGDVIRNAYLVPVFAVAYRENIRLSVNYEEQNEFLLHFENSIGRMLFRSVSTYIKHIFKK